MSIKLSEDLEEAIISQAVAGRKAWEAGDLEQAERDFLASWDAIPEPRLDYDFSQSASYGIAVFYRSTGQFLKAKHSEAYKKMSEAEKKKYLKEYARQLKRQEDAINSMSAKEFADARAMFEQTKKASGGSGRNPQADKDQRRYRKERGKEIESSIYESKRGKGVSPKDARAEAKARRKEIMEDLAVLHEPDMVAGGWHSPTPSGLGSKDVNSAIGGSWGKKERVSTLENAAKDAITRGKGSDMMNVELTICPPGKKGK